ncbi:MAG: cyclic nucleotide-binding domain-containing protein [Pseudomonadota bacterium]
MNSLTMAMEVIKPADGSRVVRDATHTVLFGQPPEVLKGLLLKKIHTLDTLVLIDTREQDGSLLNNLEFPLYYFLFVGKGLQTGSRLNLVGHKDDIGRVLRLLQLTLLGPSKAELQHWQTPEWLQASGYLALKDEKGNARSVESFFNIIPFENDEADVGHFHLRRRGHDRYVVKGPLGEVEVDLTADAVIDPPYPLQADFIPRELVKLGLEILGSASGFTANEPCTGLALCYNGDYILIDSIPYLDKHLFARGISKNQVKAVFITHLHDDHCALFPLVLMPEKVEILTTREIYAMAMEKLCCQLNWTREVVDSFFTFKELIPNQTVNYYGLSIATHITVHSVPTIGATFSTTFKGLTKSICVIGDNTGMGTIFNMVNEGVISAKTYGDLQRIYNARFDLLVADGGAGAIHGDPADALKSDAERVVFVHVEHLSNRFNTTFSLASSGKRYTVLDEDSGIYTSLMNHYLSIWLGEPLSNRWSRSILAEEEIRRYNAGDVLMVQESKTRGYVYLILTGYCEVVTYYGDQLHSIAQLQAGEIIGEMAAITGSKRRNASVVASSPVTVCVFSEEIFNAFITSEGYRDKLLTRWQLRLLLRQLPQFRELISTVLEKLAHAGTTLELPAGHRLQPKADTWYLQVEGTGSYGGHSGVTHAELGFVPFAAACADEFRATTDCQFVCIARERTEHFMTAVPQFNYLLRKYRLAQGQSNADWLLGPVNILGTPP